MTLIELVVVLALLAGLAAMVLTGAQMLTDRSEQKLKDLALTDPLTGVLNRRGLIDDFQRLQHEDRPDKPMIALLQFDLDSFKLINDSLGHMIGDQVLVAIAGRLEGTVRSSDSIARLGRNHTIARLGGDEFTILLEEISGATDAMRVAERISSDLSNPFLIGGQELFPSASIGIAIYNPSYQNPEDLLRDADTAMYSAKSLGKGRYEVFDSNMRANATARATVLKTASTRAPLPSAVAT